MGEINAYNILFENPEGRDNLNSIAIHGRIFIYFFVV
jgi:hypothetical protein